VKPSHSLPADPIQTYFQPPKKKKEKKRKRKGKERQFTDADIPKTGHPSSCIEFQVVAWWTSVH
jgi:hypothetical protein